MKFDIDRKDLYEHDKPRDRTRQRLTQMLECGMEETGTASFGIKNVMSGLYIEKVWGLSDGDFNNYMEWAKELKQKYENTNKTLNQILAKFENGTELYQTSVLFSNCVESLLRGGDVYKLLENVVVMNNSLQEKYTDIMTSGTLRQEIVVTKERFEELLNEYDRPQRTR